MTESAANNAKSPIAVICRSIFLIITATLVILPFLWMIITSLQPSSSAVLQKPLKLPWPPAFWNYLQIWEVEPFGIYGMNSIIVSFSAAFLQVVVSILAAYAFSFLRFPFKKVAFLFVLAVLMMPTQVAIIPLYSIMTDLGWLDSYAGLIIPFAADAYGIFMIKQSMGGVPRDFTEAGQIEGLGHLRLAFQIMPHLVKPSLIAYIIMAIKWRWNDYFWVLIMTSSIEKRTLPVGIVMMKEVSDGGTQWHLLMAATLVVLMPMLVLFLCLQKYFTNDYMSGAIKG